MSKLGSLVRERILILDGAMGTMCNNTMNPAEEDFRGKLNASRRFPDR